MTNGRPPGRAMLPSPAPLHYLKDSHCSYCGQRFSHDQPWPRQCAKCGNISFVNPIPVVIVLVPVDDGVLVVRRSQEPGSGVLALPGGFVELGETWQETGAREVRGSKQSLWIRIRFRSSASFVHQTTRSSFVAGRRL